MAVSFVGSKTFGHNAITAQSCSLTDLLDSAGASVSPAAGDVVFVNYVHAMATTATRTLAQCTPSGYSNTHGSIIQADDSNAVSMALSYKLMGGTPDTTVSIPAASATTAGVSCTIECWRGLDSATINTTTPTTASGSNTGLANPPSITTPAAPSGCVVLGAFGAAAASGAAFTNTGGTTYDSTTNVFKSLANTTGTNDAVSGMGAKTGLAVSTAFDAAITGSTTTNTGSWGAASIVIRPPLSSATLSVTLDALTASATGVLPLAATASPTLGALTSSATGTLSIVASFAKTLGNVTLSSTGTILIAGQASPTLGAATLSSTAVLPLAAQSAITLDAATLASTATLTSGLAAISGSAAITLGNLAASGTSTLTTHGTASISLGPLTAEAFATTDIAGQAAITLGSLSLSSAGRWLRLEPVPQASGDMTAVPAPPDATLVVVPGPGVQIVTIPLPPEALIQ